MLFWAAFPRFYYCLFAETAGLCASCWARLSPVTAPFRQHCGPPLAEQLVDSICATCWATPPEMTFFRAALRYDDVARGLILKLKPLDGLHLVTFVSQLMAARFVELTANNLFVVPVPLHRWRYWRRRFNRSAELARYLCQHYEKVLYTPDLLIRHCATKSQSGLSRQARERNLTAAFVPSPTATQKLRDHRPCYMKVATKPVLPLNTQHCENRHPVKKPNRQS